MKFAVQPYGHTRQVPVPTPPSLKPTTPGQTSIADGPASGTPRVPAASTAARKLGVNHAGADRRGNFVSVADAVAPPNARTAATTSTNRPARKRIVPPLPVQDLICPGR